MHLREIRAKRERLGKVHFCMLGKLKKRGNKPRKDECVKRDSKTNF